MSVQQILPHLVLVEDNADIAVLLRTAAEREGWRVDWFGDGQDFAERVNGFLFADLVLLDIELPGLNGVGVAEKLAAQRYTGTLVVMTGGPLQIAHQAARIADEAGIPVSGCWQKPIVTRRFLSTLSNLADCSVQM
ncbi:MAG: response regulator [Pseudomonadota bacterium]